MLRRKLAVLVVLGVLHAAPARAIVDMTGKWLVSGIFPSPTVIEFVQTGTSLSMVGVPVFPAPGTIDPATGSFGFNSSFGGCIVGLGGTVFPNVRYFSGRGGMVCSGSFSVGSVSGTRCTCSDGNSLAGDGCSPECQVEECFDCVGDPSVCTPTPDGGACSDHQDCTAGEVCSGGVCGGGTAVPACTDMTGLWRVERTVPGVLPDLSETRIYDVIQQDGIVFLSSTDRVFGGSIDPATGAFVAHHEVDSLFCGPDTMAGTVAGDGQTFAGSGVLQFVDQLAPDQCDTPTATYAGERTTCSDGTLDAGEACDDGNRTAGDGCDPLCNVEFCWTCAGSPSVCAPRTGVACDDGNACTGGDVCTAGGSCLGAFLPDGTECGDDPAQCAHRACSSGVCNPSAPLVCEPCLTCEYGVGCVAQPRSCVPSMTPGKSQLKLSRGDSPTRDRISWSFKHGVETSFAQLGDPTTATGWALCLYDRSAPAPTLLFRAVSPAGPAWRATGGRGYRFAASTPNADGVKSVKLRAAAGRDSQAAFAGKGTSLSGRPLGFPPLPLPTALTVQLQGDDATCMSMDIGAADVLHNDAGRFTAHGH